jgi:hypothetical protein
MFFVDQSSSKPAFACSQGMSGWLPFSAIAALQIAQVFQVFDPFPTTPPILSPRQARVFRWPIQFPQSQSCNDNNPLPDDLQ